MLERILSGMIWNGERFEDGTVVLSGDKVKAVEFGTIEHDADVCGYIMPGVADTHTHVADSGLVLDRRYGLEELVAPPNGLKHRYLSETSAEKIESDMSQYVNRLVSGGVSRFFDFREGGADGARMLRSVTDRAVILGRPVSKEFDPCEMDELLSVADGIGIPSITDMDHSYIDSIADAVHRKGKMLALHVSERIREDIGYVLSLQPDLIVHMTQATDRDMKACADTDVPVSVCPTSNMYFGMVPPIDRMMDAGMTVTLGTDNGMLFPSADVFGELSVFSSLLESADRRTPACLLSYVTKLIYNGSPLTEQIGSRADIVTMPFGGFPSGIGSGMVRYGP